METSFKILRKYKRFLLFCLVNFIYLACKKNNMPWNLNFAIGMGFGLLFCSILYLKYKKIPLYASLIMTGFGIWAIVPSILQAVFNISFNSNIFFFYPLITSFFPEGQYIGFLFSLFLYNIGIIGQIIYIKK